MFVMLLCCVKKIHGTRETVCTKMLIVKLTHIALGVQGTSRVTVECSIKEQANCGISVRCNRLYTILRLSETQQQYCCCRGGSDVPTILQPWLTLVWVRRFYEVHGDRHKC